MIRVMDGPLSRWLVGAEPLTGPRFLLWREADLRSGAPWGEQRRLRPTSRKTTSTGTPLGKATSGGTPLGKATSGETPLGKATSGGTPQGKTTSTGTPLGKTTSTGTPLGKTRSVFPRYQDGADEGDGQQK